MTVQEAIELLKTKIRTDSYDESFEEIQMDCALTMAIKALEKQISVEKVLERLGEAKGSNREHAETELLCWGENEGYRFYRTINIGIDKAIEIIKEEMG